MREMRRKDRKLEIEDIHYVLNTGEYGVLSTVTPDGTPYSIPISYAYDEDNNVIYMHCTADGVYTVFCLYAAYEWCVFS